MLNITYYFCIYISTDKCKLFDMAIEQIILILLIGGFILILITKLFLEYKKDKPRKRKIPEGRAITSPITTTPNSSVDSKSDKQEKPIINSRNNKEEISSNPPIGIKERGQIINKTGIQEVVAVRTTKENQFTDYNYNVTNLHKKDKELNFIEKGHLYIHKEYSLTPASNLVEGFFSKFDSQYWAEQKAIQRELEDPQQILDEWNAIGANAKELGIYLHKQIENHFQNKIVETDYHFNYTSEYVNIKEIFKIEKEFTYFKNFEKNDNIKPYRTEWHIFDIRYMIAGTIDLICKQPDNSFILYDWKRSRKLGWEIKDSFSVDNDNYNKYGLEGLMHIPDTRLNKYCLQQNIYKYILETNYGLNIKKMYLVILHPNYTKYHLVEVPDMQKEAEYMLQNKHLVIEEKK